jgi:two-component system, chemotaxis family, CheB/CheR fusion protein
VALFSVSPESLFFENIVQTISEPLLVLDSKLAVVKANAAFYRLFSTSPPLVEGQSFYRLCDGQWGSPSLRALLENLLPRKIQVKDFEIISGFDSLGERFFSLNAHKDGGI